MTFGGLETSQGSLSLKWQLSYSLVLEATVTAETRSSENAPIAVWSWRFQMASAFQNHLEMYN